MFYFLKTQFETNIAKHILIYLAKLIGIYTGVIFPLCLFVCLKVFHNTNSVLMVAFDVFYRMYFMSCYFYLCKMMLLVNLFQALVFFCGSGFPEVHLDMANTALGIPLPSIIRWRLGQLSCLKLYEGSSWDCDVWVPECTPTLVWLLLGWQSCPEF